MSGGHAVRAAAIAALRGDAALMGLVNAVFDGAPGRASAPYVVVGEGVAGDWGAKGLDAVELRLAVSLHDAGETPGALGPMLTRVAVVMASLSDAGEGWRAVTARLLRSRVAKAVRGADGWVAVVEYRVRAVRE